MAEKTAIAWADATINFWQGCQKVSEGCKYCYMMRDKERYGKDGTVVVKTKDATISKILIDLKQQYQKRLAENNSQPIRIFVDSWSDFFIKEADEWRNEAWAVIRSHPEYVWMILTKRIERAKECLPEDWGDGWPQVWLGVSAENQQRWDERVPVLVHTPAKTRFVSAEPLLSWICMETTGLYAEWYGYAEYEGYAGKAAMKIPAIDWVILGGESGNKNGKWKYRRSEEPWYCDMVAQCKRAGVAVFVKQLGTHLVNKLNLHSRSGEDISEWINPDIKIRQFPNELNSSKNWYEKENF